MLLYDIILLPRQRWRLLLRFRRHAAIIAAFAAITPRLMPRFDYFRCCRHAYAGLRCLYVAIVLPFRYFSRLPYAAMLLPPTRCCHAAACCRMMPQLLPCHAAAFALLTLF
jgi:hypothetical protein